MGKKSGSGSGMNNADQISECLETIFWVKQIWVRDPGRKKFGSGIQDGKNSDPGSGQTSRIRNTASELYTFLNMYDFKLTVFFI
jgi:hypothetical protein